MGKRHPRPRVMQHKLTKWFCLGRQRLVIRRDGIHICGEPKGLEPKWLRTLVSPLSLLGQISLITAFLAWGANGCHTQRDDLLVELGSVTSNGFDSLQENCHM